MLEVTDYMIDYVNNHILDSANVSKNEIKVFKTYTDLAMYLYNGDLEQFLTDIENEQVIDKNISLLENFFYEKTNIFHDESYEYIYLLEI